MISLVLIAVPQQSSVAAIHIALGKHGAAAGSAAVSRLMKGEVALPVVLYTNAQEAVVRTLAARLREAGAQVELRQETIVPAAPTAAAEVGGPGGVRPPPRGRSAPAVQPEAVPPALALMRYYRSRIEGRTLVMGGVASLALGSMIVVSVLLEPPAAKLPVGTGGGLSALAGQGGQPGGGAIGTGEDEDQPGNAASAPRRAPNPGAPAVQEAITVIVPPSDGAAAAASEAAARVAGAAPVAIPSPARSSGGCSGWDRVPWDTSGARCSAGRAASHRQARDGMPDG